MLINLKSKIQAALAAKKVTIDEFVTMCAAEAKKAEKRRAVEAKKAARRAAEKARAAARLARKARKAVKAALAAYETALNEELAVCSKHDKWPVPERDNRFMAMADDLPAVVYCYTAKGTTPWHFYVKTAEDLEWLTKNATLVKSYPPETVNGVTSAWQCEIALNYGVSLPVMETHDIRFTQEELLRAISNVSNGYYKWQWKCTCDDQDLEDYGFLKEEVVCPICGRKTKAPWNAETPSLTRPVKTVYTLTTTEDRFYVTKSIIRDEKCELCRTEEIGSGLDGRRDRIIVNHGLWAFNQCDRSLGGLYTRLEELNNLPTNAQICATERNKFLGGFGIVLKYPVIKASFSHDVSSSVQFEDRVAHAFDESSGCKTLKAFKKAVKRNKADDDKYTESFVCFDKHKITAFWIERQFAVEHPHFVINIWEFAEFLDKQCYVVDAEKNRWTPVNKFVSDIVDKGYFCCSDTYEFLWYLYAAGFCREQQGEDVKQFFDKLRCSIKFDYDSMLDMFGIEIPLSPEDEEASLCWYTPLGIWMQQAKSQERQVWHKNRQQHYSGENSGEKDDISSYDTDDDDWGGEPIDLDDVPF